MMSSDRATLHQRNAGLEDLLQRLNTDLSTCGADALAPYTTPALPTVFLVGCARSGTTLALQWLSHLNAFTWPTNFVSRFYAAPWVGERVQQMLTDPAYDFRGELTLETRVDPVPFTSHLGKTRGLTAPNEFWYWWRRFLPEGPTHCLTDAQLASVAGDRLSAELAAWQDVTRKPLAMKALIMNWNLPWLADAVPGGVFLHVTRDRLLNAQSLWEARREYCGDLKGWYSFKPAQYAELRDLPAAAQIAGQIHYTEAAVADGLAAIAPERRLHITYEELCESPQRVYRKLREVLAHQGCPLPESYAGPKFFPASRKLRLDPDDLAALQAAIQAYPVSP